MNTRTVTHWAGRRLVIVLALAMSGAPTAFGAPPGVSSNFSSPLALLNGSFESGFSNDNGNTFLSVGTGWHAWYLTPESGCTTHRPWYKSIIGISSRW